MNAVDKAWKVAKKALLADMKVQRKTIGGIDMSRCNRVAVDSFRAELSDKPDALCVDLGWQLYLSVR